MGQGSDRELAARIDRAVHGLNRLFGTQPDRHRAHTQSRNILQDLCGDPAFLTAVLRRYLAFPDALNARNYPVVSFNVDLNPSYHLVVNCWIPLPNRETDLSTKAIHHHGTMLLTTATAFGPGYEHWLFTRPQALDPARELYGMRLTGRKLHSRGDVAFVDAYEPHLPLYPSGLTITLALWSDREPATWKDRFKRIPFLKRNEAAFKRFAVRMGLAQALDLKMVQYFDFYPVEEGFRGMKDRIEFGVGPNEDYLYSLFHVLQATQNDHLAPLVEEQINSQRVPKESVPLVRRLLDDLRHGRPIEGRLSQGHVGILHANFRRGEIERSLEALRSRA